MEENIALGEQMLNLVLLTDGALRNRLNHIDVVGRLLSSEEDTPEGDSGDPLEKSEVADRAGWVK
jgi:hypothetical protein